MASSDAEAEPDRPVTRPKLLEKIRLHLAWRVGRRHSRQIDAALIHSVLDKPAASVCVFGRGQADLLRQLKDPGHRVLTVEPDEEAGRRGSAPGDDVLVGSIEALPAELSGRSFDAVYLNRVLQDCREPREALRNACQLLEPGGTLFAEVANHESDSARRYGAAWILCDAGRHINFFTAQSLSRFLREMGFEVEDILFRQYIPQFSGSRLAAEQDVWDRMYADSKQGDRRVPPRKSSADLWTGFLRTIFLPPRQKNEILGIIAKCRRSDKAREI